MLCPAPPALPQPSRLGWDRFLSSWSQHPARLLPCQPLPAPPACPSCLPPPPAPSCPFPFPQAPLPGKKSLFKLSSVGGGRAGGAGGPGTRRGGDLGGAGGVKALPGQRGPAAPEGSPAPARYGRRTARTSSSHPLRRGRGVPASPGDAEIELAGLVPEAAPAGREPPGLVPLGTLPCHRLAVRAWLSSPNSAFQGQSREFRVGPARGMELGQRKLGASQRYTSVTALPLLVP